MRRSCSNLYEACATPETFHVDILNAGLRKRLLKMFLVELRSMFGARQRPDVYQTVYFKPPENRDGVIPGSI